jgi:hypothetical protein
MLRKAVPLSLTFIQKNMDIPLINALDALKQKGAQGLPAAASVEAAANGTRWNGKKKDGDRWYLVKHKTGSYNAEF